MTEDLPGITRPERAERAARPDRHWADLDPDARAAALVEAGDRKTLAAPAKLYPGQFGGGNLLVEKIDRAHAAVLPSM